MPGRKRKKHWSYNAGERGSNWVRVYEDPKRGLYIEFFDDEARPDGTMLRKKRRRSLGHRDRAKAAAKAEEMAKAFAALTPAAPRTLSLAQLLTLYLKEVTPTKGESSRGHDRLCGRLFRAFFDAQPEPARHATRHPNTLDRLDWDRFVTARRGGQIPEFEGRVKDRQVQYDLKFLIAVLNWATAAGVGGVPYLERNPWGADIRRAQKWPMPRELNPRRPGMTDELRAALIAHGPESWQFGAALQLERETRRRNSAIRRLVWSDIDLEHETIRWRGETDKAGRANVTPLTPRAVAMLRSIPRGIGETPVFPSAKKASEPTSRHTFQIWMRRAKRRYLKTLEGAELVRAREQLRGLGYHGEKRAGVRDPRFRALEAAIQEEIAGTNFETLRNTYDEVTVGEIQEAMTRARLGA